MAVLAIVLGTNFCWGQALDTSTDAKKAREELCQKVLCRSPTTIRVLLKDNRVLEVAFQDVSLIVLPNGWVSVLPGEEVHIAFEVDGESLRNARAVKQATDAQNVLSFRFNQDPKTGDSFLTVNSTLEKVVKFDLGMMLPENEQIRKTSSCPVLGGKTLYEHWPHPIFQFVAAKFRLLPPGSGMKCE